MSWMCRKELWINKNIWKIDVEEKKSALKCILNAYKSFQSLRKKIKCCSLIRLLLIFFFCGINFSDGSICLMEKSMFNKMNLWKKKTKIKEKENFETEKMVMKKKNLAINSNKCLTIQVKVWRWQKTENRTFQQTENVLSIHHLIK